jgi:alpha-2-macroglobulin-like protein
MAILKSEGKNAGEMTKAVKWLVASRNGYGAFGNTQGTILALKALTEYAKYSKQIREDGKIIVFVDGKKAGEKEYKAGEKNAIVMEGLETYIKGEGSHDILVKFEGTKTALPYSVAVSWNTSLPNSQKECVVDLKTKLFTTTANVGETVRFSAKVTNKKNEGIPSTMVILGIPAGFTVQPWQLKELQDKKVFDYYEVSGNNIAIYYRCMAPAAVKEINLDLKAEMPGEYDAPASTAYLYYTNEFKTWNAVDRITIKKTNG